MMTSVKLQLWSGLCSSLLGFLSFSVTSAYAEEMDAGSKLKVSGFLSIVGGRTFGGELPANYTGPAAINDKTCPCYVADWSNAGVYNNSFSLQPESRAGVQATYAISKDFSLTGQVVVRGTDSTPNIQWAYASYKLNKEWEVQVGRKRIPLYFYSDFQDVGAAYPWVSPPPELYGWEVTNYNGASVRYRTSVADNNVAFSVFGGKEKSKDSLYEKLVFSGQTDVTWSNIIGADAELERGPLTVRAVYVQSDVKVVNSSIALDSAAKLKAYGIAVNLDMDQWFFLSELTQLSRNFDDAGYTVTAPSYTLGAGYRMGAWTPFLNYASYKEKTSDLSKYQPQAYKRLSFTLRYDIDAKSAVKLQLDKNQDTTNNFGGNVNVFRISYDRLF
ncbi:porin family protein [Undibacterium curvum]|uniref:Porin n=1 Tax=Undibacterium curvum TaxID=2762294 RepID=A0ABR7A0Y6_9BURK|nr:hypothetical protein [Undibacterium curvum]MBC3930565.1 hypothetical protein [Undibacterium curvum]